MGFEEIRDKLLYLHKNRDLSKRKNKFTIIDDKENRPANNSRSNSSKRSSRHSECISIEPKRKDLDNSSNDDPFETYVPERDPKNKARYLPPSKLKKAPNSYQGRRVVKFKEANQYSEEQYGPLKREKRPAPRKIMCVTEIMADISDTESEGSYEDTTSQEKATKASNSDSGILKSVSELNSVATRPESKTMLPPDKFEFLNQIRKRSQKAREKETEAKEERQISETLINKFYSSGSTFKLPIFASAKTQKYTQNLATMIMKKFHDKQSVNKIIQKTAKLQKNLETSEKSEVQDDTTSDAIRYCMMQRIKSLQRVRAENYQGRNRQRGRIEPRFLKFRYQGNDKTKRKTRNFQLYDQKELDFPDANNLLKKRLNEFEFDNDVNSDEDEIAKSAYVRLKDLTITLKETLKKGVMLENDADDLEIKKAVGLREDDTY